MKKSTAPLKEKDYNYAVDQEAKFFHVDTFSIILFADKETALTKIAEFFKVSYDSLTKMMSLEEVLALKKSIQPRVFCFDHYLPCGKAFQPLKKLAKECRGRNIISILDISKSIQKTAPVLFPTDIVLCEKESYCVMLLNETYLKDSHGLLLRKQLSEGSILQKEA